MSHTPGPWRVGFEHSGVSAGILDRNPGYIGVIAPAAPFVFGGVVALTKSQDDARLIAAAPDMLAALRDVQSQCAGHSDEFSRRVWIAADMAIAKAEGR